VVEPEILGSFKNHDNYDGVFLGKQDQNWHLEFTTSLSKVNHKFDVDDILVFYPEQISEYDKVLERIAFYGIERVIPENPYWRNNGIMIKDPDGYCIVIGKQKIK
jgi:hypothetical protein